MVDGDITLQSVPWMQVNAHRYLIRRLLMSDPFPLSCQFQSDGRKLDGKRTMIQPSAYFSYNVFSLSSAMDPSWTGIQSAQKNFLRLLRDAFKANCFNLQLLWHEITKFGDEVGSFSLRSTRQRIRDGILSPDCRWMDNIFCPKWMYTFYRLFLLEMTRSLFTRVDSV